MRTEDPDQAWQPWRRSLNPNTLYALDAILHAPSLTEAARAVALGQPAMSMALRRLREHFGDEIVSYDGGRRELTALAIELRPRVRRLLRDLNDTLNLELTFDPGTARRTIALSAPEPIEIMLLSRAVPALIREAPGIEVRLMPFNHGSIERMFDRGCDLVITPRSLADPAFDTRPLFDQRIVVMAWDRHPLATRPYRTLSVAEYMAARHAALFEHIERHEFGELHAQEAFARRHVAVRTGLYSMLPALAVGTDLIVTTTNWLAQYHAAMLPLTLIEMPMRQEPEPVIAQWQPHRDREPVIRWLVAKIVAIVGQIGPAGNRWDQQG